MGGICGVVDFRAGARVERETVERMCALIAHRGPEQGVHVEGGVGLGARRLPITDLVTGQQPLSNEDGTVWVTFNGEIYNHEELRPPLEARGHRFKTKTDTEVIPHLYEEHGLDFVQHLEGNWALGLWDSKRRRLVLTRDRMGRRHLMWSFKDGVVRFASETKAILSDPAVSRDVDPRAVVDVIKYGVAVENRTMFREVSALRPSQMLVFEDGRLVSDGLYWDYYDVAPFEGTFEEGIDAFEDVFGAAVRSRLGGDVPYGVLQSGGIDSSLIASFVADEGVPLRTYTISTGGIDDETDAATAVARHVGAEHTLIPLSKADPVEIAPKIPWMTDGPFMNDGLIANLLLARSIGSEVTVAITGDGGDHTFAGTWVHLGDAMAQRVPRPLAPVGAWVTDAGHALTRNRTARRLSKGFHGARIPQRSRWLAMRQHDMPGRHPGLLATGAWRVNGFDPDAEALTYYDRCTAPDHLSRVIYAETRWDLPPNDMLKVDRACAYGGMAARSPFFDRRVVEFASSLPADWKIQGRTLKPLGREVARRRLPSEIATLPKTGLSTPMRDWMRGPFGERVGRLLASDSFASRGIFDPKGAQTVLERHRAGRGDYAHVAWTMAVTELFFRSFVDTFAMPDERVWDERVRVLLVVGTRPNFMKIAPVARALDKRPGFERILVHTGQHYDDAMSRVFLEELGVGEPDFFLDVGSGTHAEQTARVLERIEPVLVEAAPDLVLVPGDVNSTLAAALAAVKLGIPVGHVEAGLRSFDRTMPEELNRILTDAISDLLFTHSPEARMNLEREGAIGAIHEVGNTMIDTLVRLRPRIDALDAPARHGLTPGEYVVVTLHRPALVDGPLLGEALAALGDLAREVPVVFPAHPRTRAALDRLGLDAPPGLQLLDPLPYLEFLGLVAGSAAALTDSGGIQEETTYLGIPCFTLRSTTERPVTVELGTNTLLGLDPARIRDVPALLAAGGRAGQIPPGWDGHAAERIVDVL